MNTLRHTLALIITILSVAFSYAQDGQYNVRFNMYDYDCDTKQLLIDIDVQSVPGKEFRISDQNYRFSFNRDAVSAIFPAITGVNPNPVDRSVFIEDEMTLSSFVIDDQGGFSFFDAHTLTGSIDTVVSYNVRLAGGDGYYIGSNDWTNVGRLRFTISDEDAMLNLKWHNHDPSTFPPTFIGEKAAGSLTEATEGAYTDLSLVVADLCAGPLPVEMTRFDAISKDCIAYLEWETATETNNDHFLVQRSFDGRTFETIATVQGNGNATTPSYYSFADENIQAENYYRLVQVDFDGTTTTSDVKFVKSDCFEVNPEDGSTTLFPNPVSNGTPITLRYFNATTAKDASIIITDVAGRILHTQTLNLASGYIKTTIDVDQLAPGTYFVRIQGDNWFGSSKKFVKIAQ